jgi:hypothetical protein
VGVLTVSPRPPGAGRSSEPEHAADFNDPDRLDLLLNRILDVATWGGLLASADS